MMPIDHSTLVLLCVLSGIGLMRLLLMAAGRLDAWLSASASRRVDEFGMRFITKVVRHAISGRVGLCISAGWCRHRWLGSLRVKFIVQVVFCPKCALHFHGGTWIFPNHSVVLDVREVVAALPEEIAAFHLAMERSQG